jgi:hypothetical protein
LLTNYSAAAQRKWLASVEAARAQKAHASVPVTRGERAVMLTWLQGVLDLIWSFDAPGIPTCFMTTLYIYIYSRPLRARFNRHRQRRRKSLPWTPRTGN